MDEKEENGEQEIQLYQNMIERWTKKKKMENKKYSYIKI